MEDHEADSLLSGLARSPAYHGAERVSEPQERKAIIVTAEYVLARATCEGVESCYSNSERLRTCSLTQFCVEFYFLETKS